MTRVCIIGIWFGPFPPWNELWIKSVRYNPTIDFLVVTDQAAPQGIPDNLRYMRCTLSEFKALSEKKIGMPIRMEYPYKICDYKCLYGAILENEIVGYDYWAECDFDLIFGVIRSFIEKNEIGRYDKFLHRGHLTFYRNQKEVIDRYKLSGGSFGSYKEVFRSDLVWGLDEMYGINRIYRKHGFSSFNTCVFADIDRKFADLRLSSSYFAPGEEYNYDPQIFSWKEGKVFQEWIDSGSNHHSREWMYIHFAKRRFEKPPTSVVQSSRFCITPNGFIEYPELMTSGFMKRNNPKDQPGASVRKDKTSTFDKKMKFFWIGRRYLNAKHRFKQLVCGKVTK